MKAQKLLRTALFVFLSTLLYSPSFAQGTGTIVGQITDKATGEPIIGAAVKIFGTTKGISTNVDGRYALTGLLTGKYTLEVFYIGYSTKKITEVDVKAGNSTEMNVVLQETGQTLNTVVITATAKQESINSLYARQKNSSSISDGISAESIRKSPDKTTSDVLKRVSGTTIQDNKFVVIRGLGDRYNNAMLDGVALPSTEPNRKAFSFDIVPANLIDNVVISKTATPDLPSDFAGGTIQIITKDIPDRDFMQIGAGYGYNSASTFKKFQSGYRNTSDYLGFDGGQRALSSNFPSTTSIINSGSAQSIPLLKTLNNSFQVYDHSAFLGQNYQFTMGRVREIGKNNNKFGAIISLTYRTSETTNPDVERKYNGYNFTDDQYKFSVNTGGLANFTYSFGKNKIVFKNIYNRIFDDVFTYRTGSNAANSSNDSKFYAYDLTEKSLLKSALEGVHQIGDKSAVLKWDLGVSNIINDQPDQRKVNYIQNSPGDPFVASVTTLGKENTRFFSTLNEYIYSGNASLTLPVSVLSTSGSLKVGAYSQFRRRNFNARFIGLVINTNMDGYNDVRTRPVEYLFSPNVINNGYFDLQEIPNFNDRYIANSTTIAGFAMIDSKLTEHLRAVYGVRVEQFKLNLTTRNTTGNAASLDNLDVLPSVNLTYALTPKANLRGSYYRTLARPEFRELAPFSYYDYENFASVLGNPNLKRSSINNADVRYEYYPHAGQIFSVSAFYKHFSNAIEPTIEDQNSTPTLSYFNSNTAKVYGLELEARRTLDFIQNSSFLKNTTAYVNLSLIHSRIENLNPNAIAKFRPLVGQSPYMLNAGLQHTAFSNKFSVNLLFNRIGRRIYLVGGTRFPDIYENPRNVVDMQLSLKVMKMRGEIKINASDLFNQQSLFYFDYDKSGNFTPTDEILKRYKQGTTFSLGFTYNIR